MARFASHYRAAEDFTAFALVVHAAEDHNADVFPHTLFGAARFLLLRLLQVTPCFVSGHVDPSAYAYEMLCL